MAVTDMPTYKELEQRVKELEAESSSWQKREAVFTERENRFRLLYDRAPLSYQSLDAFGRIIEINQAWLDTLGYTRQEVLGRSFADFLSPEWQDHFKQFFPRFKAIGEILGEEFELVRKDGTIIIVSLTGRLGHNDQGAFQQTHCIFQNITDRKLAEREKQENQQVQAIINRLLLLAMENSSLPEILEHFIGQLTSLSFLGFESTGAALLVEEEPGVLVLEAQRNMADAQLEQCARVPFGKCLCGQAALSGRIVFADRVDERHEIQHPGITPHGHYCVPIVSVQQKVVGVFTVYIRAGCRRDPRIEEILLAVANMAAMVIERKRAEEDLRTSSDNLKIFAYSVIHDLKNPAVAVHGLARLLAARHGAGLTAKGREYCDQILYSSEQIVALVEKIKAFIATRENLPVIEPINLAELFRMIRGEFATRLEARKIEWSASTEPPEIRADRLALMRGICNLVDNALKYGGDRLGRIRLGCSTSPAFYTLWVSDDGVGVLPEDSGNIFGLFQRKRSAPHIEGTGLGLAIVKEIATQHNGRAWVESEPGQGMTVSISISRQL